jgi:hypothetical protein
MNALSLPAPRKGRAERQAFIDAMLSLTPESGRKRWQSGQAALKGYLA